MTSEEFNSWKRYHLQSFRNVESWLLKMPAPEQGETLGRWFKVVSFYSLDDCKRATDDLLASTEDVAFDRHPGKIADLALRHYLRRQPSSSSQRDLGHAAPTEELIASRQRTAEHFGFKTWQDYKHHVARKHRMRWIEYDPSPRKPYNPKPVSWADCLQVLDKSHRQVAS